MYDLNESITNVELSPVACLVVYSAEGNHHPYIETSRIENGIQKESRPLSKDEMKELCSSLIEENQEKDFTFGEPFMKIFDGKERTFINYEEDYNYTKITWAVKGKVRRFIKNKRESELYYPNLLFVADNNNLKIFSYKGIIKENSILYKAPFPNIYSNGNMCFGNMNYNNIFEKNVSRLVKNVENAFFYSSFNNDHLDSEGVTKSNTSELLKRLSECEEKKPFPKGELVKTNKKLSDVLYS